MKSSLKTYQLTPAAQLRCQLTHVARSRIRQIIRDQHLPLDSPQLVAQVIKEIKPELYQKLHSEQGDPENWVTFPMGLSPEVFYHCISGLLTKANFVRTICKIYNLDPNQAIARSVSPSFLKALHRAMWVSLVKATDRLQQRAKGHQVVMTAPPSVLAVDFEVPSIVKINEDDILIEESWEDQLVASGNPEILQFTIEACISGKSADMVAMLGYLFVHQPTGAIEIALDARCCVWEGAELFIGRKRIDAVKLRDQNIHEVVLGNVLRLLASHGISLTSIAVQLFGIDLFQYQSIYLLAKEAMSHREREQVAFRSTALCAALNHLGLAHHQLHVVQSDGLPIAVYVEAGPLPSMLSMVA